MGLLPLCSGDPVESLLRETFKADILRVPEVRVQPLGVIARRGERARLVGTLGGLLQGTSPFSVTPDAPTPVADVSGKRTLSISLKLGLDLLRGMVQGFGVGLDAARVELALGERSKIAFSFEEVERVAVNLGELNRALLRRKLQTAAPGTTIFFSEGPWGEPYQLLLIDSVLRSGRFRVHVEGGGDLRARLPDLGGLLDGTALSVEQSAERELTFRRATGQPAPSFAFTCLRVYLKEDGAMTLAPDSVRGGLESLARAGGDPRPQRIGEAPCLLSFDEDPAA